jgi:hypothetical protein
MARWPGPVGALAHQLDVLFLRRAGRPCAPAPSARRPPPWFVSWSRHVLRSDPLVLRPPTPAEAQSSTDSPPPGGWRNSKRWAARTGAPVATACSPDPTPRLKSGQTRRRHADAVVLHGELERVCHPPADDGDAPGRRPRADAVLDGVFDQRLQHRFGTSASSVSGCDIEHGRSDGRANRVCSISRYLARKSSSSLSVTSCWPTVVERHAQQVAQLRIMRRPRPRRGA